MIFLSAENMNVLKLIYVENIDILNGNVPVLTPLFACLPRQLTDQLPSSSFVRCRTYVLQSAQKSTFHFQNTRKGHSKSSIFDQAN